MKWLMPIVLVAILGLASGTLPSYQPLHAGIGVAVILILELSQKTFSIQRFLLYATAVIVVTWVLSRPFMTEGLFAAFSAIVAVTVLTICAVNWQRYGDIAGRQ